MGRELVTQLAAAACSVATCDVSAANMAETMRHAEAVATGGALVSTFVADVADERQLVAFRDHVASAHSTDHVEYLFNNAGIGGAGSVVTDEREEWDKVFAVCWGGVYLGTRTFLPMLMAAERGHVVNTSSVNGFWATLAGQPHTAYSAAKFAVKGFTEALLDDFKVNAPHLRASVVMPGHIGTSIVFNSLAYFGRDPKELSEQGVADFRDRAANGGFPLDDASDEDVRGLALAMAEGFRDNAPMTAADAATVILEGVRAGEWRILVGMDAQLLDEAVRADPAGAYTPEFLARLQQRNDVFGGMPMIAPPG